MEFGVQSVMKRRTMLVAAAAILLIPASQAVAQDSMKLSHEITALYLSSFKDQGLLTRLLTLPANIVRDAANLSIVNSSDRKKMEERLVGDMNALDKRLAEIQENAPKK